jgi:hypothetical protein
MREVFSQTPKEHAQYIYWGVAASRKGIPSATPSIPDALSLAPEGKLLRFY